MQRDECALIPPPPNYAKLGQLTIHNYTCNVYMLMFLCVHWWFVTLVVSRGKRNVTVWRPSVRSYIFPIGAYSS